MAFFSPGFLAVATDPSSISDGFGLPFERIWGCKVPSFNRFDLSTLLSPPPPNPFPMIALLAINFFLFLHGYTRPSYLRDRSTLKSNWLSGSSSPCVVREHAASSHKS